MLTFGSAFFICAFDELYSPDGEFYCFAVIFFLEYLASGELFQKE
jgi:hypothetical protein